MNCGVCGKQYKRQAWFKKHQQICNNKSNEIKITNPPILEVTQNENIILVQEEIFECSICYQVTKTENSQVLCKNNHSFCIGCIAQLSLQFLFEHKVDCPLCRANCSTILQDNIIENVDGRMFMFFCKMKQLSELSTLYLDKRKTSRTPKTIDKIFTKMRDIQLEVMSQFSVQFLFAAVLEKYIIQHKEQLRKQRFYHQSINELVNVICDRHTELQTEFKEVLPPRQMLSNIKQVFKDIFVISIDMRLPLFLKKFK